VAELVLPRLGLGQGLTGTDTNLTGPFGEMLANERPPRRASSS
jgi:hypothetical protein